MALILIFDDDIDILDSVFWIPQYSTQLYAEFKEQVQTLWLQLYVIYTMTP